jgi:hypothetical protein
MAGSGSLDCFAALLMNLNLKKACHCEERQRRSNLQTTCESSGDCFASLAKTAKVLPGFVTAQRGEALAMTN